MRRFVICVIAAASAALIPASASAAAPTIIHYMLDGGPSLITDVCTAGITFRGHVVATEADYVDNSGMPTHQRISSVETDTFTGPTGSLTSDPYTYETFFYFDNGSIVSGKAVGVILKIRLPDGSLFLSAGHVILHPNGPIFTFVPDKGRSGDMKAFCAALGAA